MDKIVEAIRSNDNFLIASHAHPDGDGIGSTLALGLALEKMGKKVTMYNQDGVPDALDFLHGAPKIHRQIAGGAKFGVSIMVDCSQPERAGRDFPDASRRGILVCIDHHATGRENAEINFLDEGASSTGEVVYGLIRRLGAEITPEIATMILTTIVVDTGFFRYSNTTVRTLALAAELVSAGASTWEICRNIEERNPPEQLKLMKLCLETVDYFLDGKMSLMFLTGQMFKEAGASVEVAEEFINFPRSIAGVEVAVLIRELSPKKFKISFRSKDSVNVAALAGKFDGGGHEHAAGCTIDGSLGSVKETVIRAVREALKEG